MAFKENSNTHLIRQYAAINKTVTRKQVREDLGLTTDEVYSAWQTLLNQGFLKKVSHGLYKFEDNTAKLKVKDSPVEDKMWSAMRINPTFTVADIALQAGTTENYVHKKLQQYKNSGLIKPRGSKLNMAGNSRVSQWALTNKGRGMREKPRLESFEPDPLVKKVVELNRLVCTGRVPRNVDDSETALKLIREVSEEIEKRRKALEV